MLLYATAGQNLNKICEQTNFLKDFENLMLYFLLNQVDGEILSTNETIFLQNDWKNEGNESLTNNEQTKLKKPNVIFSMSAVPDSQRNLKDSTFIFLAWAFKAASCITTALTI